MTLFTAENATPLPKLPIEIGGAVTHAPILGVLLTPRAMKNEPIEACVFIDTAGGETAIPVYRDGRSRPMAGGVRLLPETKKELCELVEQAKRARAASLRAEPRR